MSIRIDDGGMSPEIDGRVIATATERGGGCWEVSHWPRFFDRNQAITRPDGHRTPGGRARQQ